MIAIVDCGIGNVGSVLNMLRKIGVAALVSRDPEVVGSADKVVLPGVGAFDHGMTRLHESGLVPTLARRVLDEGVPLLGICLGLQMLTRGSEEGSCPGLAWLPARTVRFSFDAPQLKTLKVPHMGWNTVQGTVANSWPSLRDNPRFYFVHSYHVECDSERDVLATAHYGYEFAVAVRRGSVAGVQFHPEKSHRFGMAILRDFAGSA